MSSSLNPLEILLRNYGALTINAWNAMIEAANEKTYGSSKAVALQAGGMVYIMDGLLKQYARAERTQPSIIRFVQRGQVLFVPYACDSIYVKTIERSVLYYWDEYTLREIMIAHPELMKIYMKLRDLQEAALDFKALLLEQEVSGKLELFNNRYQRVRPFIKNKDMANFLHVSESTLSRSKNQYS